jgi:RNA polymerase sigma factor (TIGR02999 family)
MISLARREITRQLIRASDGDREALDELIPVVYAELRRVAQRQLGRERPGHTLDSAALVHEAYLKLVDQDGLQWQNRAHFYAIAARSMRTILIDHARSRSAAKRGGGIAVVTLERIEPVASPERDEHLLALDETLTRLAEVSPEASQTVELRYFGGLTLEEVAVVLDLSLRTVRRRWAFAKAWLQRELGEAR